MNCKTAFLVTFVSDGFLKSLIERRVMMGYGCCIKGIELQVSVPLDK